MKTEMSPLKEKSIYTCQKCKRELSHDDFYVNKTTQKRDKYCKECRKEMSRRQYSNDKRTRPLTAVKTPRTDITQIVDRELRIKLIQQALEVVHQSMERKKRKMQELEDSLEEGV